MDQMMLVVVIAAIVLGLFILGMSITLIRKGHHIQSEIGENPEMKKRGIKCTAQQMRDEERGSADSSCAERQAGCGAQGGCASCGQNQNDNIT